MSRNFFELENGISMVGPISNFQLVYDNTPVTPPSCCNLSYMPGILIAVKCDKVIVYKPEIEIVDNVPTLVKIADFCTYNPGAYLKISIGEKSYIIDSNVQITLCSCKKIY